MLSNFVSWGNLLKGQNNKKNNVKGCGYIERYHKKGEGGELEICTQTWWKLKQWFKAGLTFSIVWSLSSMKLVSSIWNSLVKLHPIDLWSEFSQHSDKSCLFVI